MKLKYLIICVVIYSVCLVSQQIWLTKDAAVYVLLARSLAKGRDYFDYYFPEPKPHTFYPPGYPFILSLVTRLFGDRLLVLRMANIVMAGLFLIILIKVLNETHDKRYMNFIESLVVIFRHISLK